MFIEELFESGSGKEFGDSLIWYFEPMGPESLFNVRFGAMFIPHTYAMSQEPKLQLTDTDYYNNRDLDGTIIF